MTLAMAGARKDAGVTVAEVNLKFIWDVVSQIKAGERGKAYVVDAEQRLIAHPDLSLVLRNTTLSPRSAAGSDVARDPEGREVLSASAAVPPLGWRVFVDLPTSEAHAPLCGARIKNERSRGNRRNDLCSGGRGSELIAPAR
jgi:hypothetical protein